MKLRLIDCDGDLQEPNGNSQWDNFADCKKDVLIAIQASDMSLTYRPYKFVDTDSASRKSEMDVYAVINKLYISLDCEEFVVNKEDEYV